MAPEAAGGMAAADAAAAGRAAFGGSAVALIPNNSLNGFQSDIPA